MKLEKLSELITYKDLITVGYITNPVALRCDKDVNVNSHIEVIKEPNGELWLVEGDADKRILLIGEIQVGKVESNPDLTTSQKVHFVGEISGKLAHRLYEKDGKLMLALIVILDKDQNFAVMTISPNMTVITNFRNQNGELVKTVL